MSNIANLFIDDDKAVENQAKLFFHEVNKKDTKTIRNLLPNFISRLSSQDVGLVFFLFREVWMKMSSKSSPKKSCNISRKTETPNLWLSNCALDSFPRIVKN